MNERYQGRSRRVVVVGASLAGLRACETLRAEGFTGTISLIGAEFQQPYDRPPLSKKFLAGEWEADRILLRKQDQFDQLDLDLHLGVEATGIDVADHILSTDDPNHPRLHFDATVIATGAMPRRLPGQPDWPGIHVLRTLTDAASLRDQLVDGRRVVVIGAGFIGLEVAATARQRGCAVTVLEAAAAPLERGLGSAMGAAVAAVHGRNGVDLRCGVAVTSWIGDASGVRGVVTDGAAEVAADVVIVGVGVTPAVGWLDGSGLTVRDGVVCDDGLRAAPRVWAAGDCARWPNRLFGPAHEASWPGEEMRVEHWTNAAEQGAHAARNILASFAGAPASAYESVPFFWSDQFDSRIQFVGRVHGDDEVHVVAGDPSTGPCAVLYGFAGRLRGVLGVSMPKMVMPFRALIAQRASWDAALVKAAELAPAAS